MQEEMYIFQKATQTNAFVDVLLCLRMGNISDI